MSAPIKGRVVCGAEASHCRCVKDPGHVEAGDPVHACNPEVCAGSWRGEFGAPTFLPVTFPIPPASVVFGSLS